VGGGRLARCLSPGARYPCYATAPSSALQLIKSVYNTVYYMLSGVEHVAFVWQYSFYASVGGMLVWLRLPHVVMRLVHIFLLTYLLTCRTVRVGCGYVGWYRAVSSSNELISSSSSSSSVWRQNARPVVDSNVNI